MPELTPRGDTARSSWGSLPRKYQSRPAPPKITGDWPHPPIIEDVVATVGSVYDTGTAALTMDLALFEQLNEEYRSKPLVPRSPGRDQASREERARARLTRIHAQINLADKRVLELGCGSGFEAWYISHRFGSDVVGVDVTERAAWASLKDERTHFLCADLATNRTLPADSFDRIISMSVLEHVVHPYAVINELFRLLKPGGLAWISANLHRGPRASHLYREIFFPFPHLLFTDDVIRAFMEKHHGRSSGASWVNRLTWAQYEDYFRNVGFTLRSLHFTEAPIDESFYERFSGVLGRYPRWDLSKDFFTVVLQKPRRTARRNAGQALPSAARTEHGAAAVRGDKRERGDDLDLTIDE